MSRTVVLGIVALGATVVASAPAAGAIIETGTYRLNNHPDGNARPPLYGLRLDELYNVTSNHDIFTFDFDHPDSYMVMEYTGTTIRIVGQAYGGRDVGSSYANDQYLGLYTVDFLYEHGVGLAPGDDDLLVDLPEGFYNYGSIWTPLGDRISLRDGHYSGDQPNFRFGDTDNDLGHRGFAGLSGWGWLFHGPYGSPYVANSDWLFTGSLIPTPGSAALLIGAALMGVRRRRD